MLDQQQIDAMKKVMANLGKVEAQSLGTYVKQEIGQSDGKVVTEGRKFTDPNVGAMHDILSKLSTVTTNTKQKITEQSKTNTRLRQFTEMEEVSGGVRLSNKYEINIREEQFGATVKNVYDVYHVETGKKIYEGLALFESVMIITKNLLRNNPGTSFLICDRIAELDKDYARHLTEASIYKARIKKGATGDQLGIYESKYSRAIAEAKSVKSLILKG